MTQQPLPNFTQAGVHAAQVSNELQQQFQLMNNLPTVQLTQITNQLTQITQAITRLDTKIDMYNTNNMARLQNACATSPNDPLAALANITTGAVIANFPPNSASIAHLTANQVRAILQDLGQTIPVDQAGGVAFLRRQLRVQLGLRGDQIQGVPGA